MAVRNDVPLRIFHPIWPERHAVDATNVTVGYDQLSDTLFVDLYGAARPAVSVLLEDASDLDVYLRVDPITEAVVGLQIEGVRAIPDHPAWVDLAAALAKHERQDSDSRLDGGERREAVDAIFEALGPRPGYPAAKRSHP
jgi:hypothetical protein